MSDSMAKEEPLFKKVKFDLPKMRIMDLPNEILKKIFLHLKKKTVHFSVALVCKRFCEITRLPKEDGSSWVLEVQAIWQPRRNLFFNGFNASRALS